MLKLTGFEAQVEVLGGVRNARFSGSTLSIDGLNLAEAKDVIDVLENGRIDRADGAITKVEVVQPAAAPAAKADAPKEAAADVDLNTAASPEEEPPTAKPKPKRKRKSRAKKAKDDVGKVDEAPAAASEKPQVGTAAASGGAPTVPAENTQASTATTKASDADDFGPADKEFVCKACSDTGVNSRGNVCKACLASRSQTLPPPAEDDFADPTTTSQRAAGNGKAKPGSVEAPHKQNPPKLPEANDMLAPPGGLPEEVVTAVRLRQVLNYMLDHGFNTKELVVAECLRIKADVPVLSRITNLEERVERTLSVMDVGGQFSN